MTTTPIRDLRISELLDIYFGERCATAGTTVRGRLLRVRRHLETFLDEQAWRGLTEGDRELLRAEKELDPVGAFARLMHAEDLICAFYWWVQPEFRMTFDLDAKEQVRIASQMIDWMHRRGYVRYWRDMSCIILDVRHQVQLARNALAF